MAMEVETQIPNPLKPNHRTFFTHQEPPQSPYNNAFEIKVVYIRLISSKPLESTVEMVFPPRNSAAHLIVNGMEVGPGNGISVALNKNRVDKFNSESIHVGTNSIKAFGSCLPFEIREGGCCALVVGELRRKGEGTWMMECREGEGRRGVEGAVQVVEVCVAGRSSTRGRPILLSRVVEVERRRWGGLDCKIHEGDGRVGDDSKAIEEEKVMNEVMLEEEEGEEEEGELSWFNAGVRVGMGLGLGMCLGVGVGVGLAIRSYQATVGTFKRLI